MSDVVSQPTLAGRDFVCSWSGGKDGYLALQRAVRQGGRPRALLCMTHEDGAVSRGHGLPLGVLEWQAAVLGLPLIAPPTTWDDYEATFTTALCGLQEAGVGDAVFGDIDLEPHREWVTRVSAVAGMRAHLPLWQEPRDDLLAELFTSGVRATIVAVDAQRLDARYLGCELTPALVRELQADGVDACGEEGEYHTVVTHAPLFAAPVRVDWQGMTTRDGHWVLAFTASADAFTAGADAFTAEAAAAAQAGVERATADRATDSTKGAW